MGWVVIQYKNSKILGISVCRRPIPASRNAVLSVCHHHKKACFLIKIDDMVIAARLLSHHHLVMVASMRQQVLTDTLAAEVVSIEMP